MIRRAALYLALAALGYAGGAGLITWAEGLAVHVLPHAEAAP